LFNKKDGIMKEEELDNYLKELMHEKPSDGFTDGVMNAIELEVIEVKQPLLKRIQGKSILLFLFVIFSISFALSLNSPGASTDYFSLITEYLHLDTINFEGVNIDFKVMKFSNITAYAIMGLLILFWIDILFVNKKRLSDFLS